MPSNKVKRFIEKLLSDQNTGEINVSVNKKDQKVFITIPENLIAPLLIQLISKLNQTPGFSIPPGKVLKEPIFAYTTEGNYINSEAHKLGSPWVESGKLQKVIENLKNGCSLELNANQIDLLCKAMNLNYGYKDFVWVLEALGNSVNANVTQASFKLEEKEEFPCKTPEQFVKAYRAKVNDEWFSAFKGDVASRLNKELPVISMDAIKKEVESDPASDTAEVYRKLSSS